MDHCYLVLEEFVEQKNSGVADDWLAKEIGVIKVVLWIVINIE